jgi:hypothetical protein
MEQGIPVDLVFLSSHKANAAQYDGGQESDFSRVLGQFSHIGGLIKGMDERQEHTTPSSFHGGHVQCGTCHDFFVLGVC